MDREELAAGDGCAHGIPAEPAVETGARESWPVAAHMRQRGSPVRGSTVDGVMGWPARGLGLGSIRGMGSGGCGGGADGVSELPGAGGGDEDGSPVRGSGGDGKPDGDLGSVEPVCASAGAAASMTAASASATFRARVTVDLLVISAPAGRRRRGQCLLLRCARGVGRFARPGSQGRTDDTSGRGGSQELDRGREMRSAVFVALTVMAVAGCATTPCAS